MLWKDTQPSSRPALSAILFLLLAAPFNAPPAAARSGAGITIIHPKEDEPVAAVDSTFILGSVPPDTKKHAYKLFINDRFVPVHPGGGFIAFLPITSGDFEFELEALLVEKDRYRHLTAASKKSDILSLHILRRLSKTHRVKVPLQPATLPYDSLAFAREYDLPLGALTVAAPGRLSVSFQATPGRSAWFSVPGVVDSVPMVELAPREQPLWGESVFGAGQVPDSVKVGGIYSGFYDIQPADRCDTARIIYHVGRLTTAELLQRYWTPPYVHDDSLLLRYLTVHDTTRLDTTGSYTVTLNSPEYPFTVRFTDSVQIVRHAPLKGYFSIFQPEGVQALVVGSEGDWHKIQLSRSQFGWVQKSSVQRLPGRAAPIRSYPSSVRFIDQPDKLIVEIPLSGKHPFRVIEDDARTMRLQLFGVTSNTDWIRYNSSTSPVDLATWSQPEEDLYELKLSFNKELWGFDTYYKGNTFYLQINKPPAALDKLKNKIIV
ncbi:MAG: hypothetical protein JSW34_09600, partial [Candidatus Zixiibacteriota bacterium]